MGGKITKQQLSDKLIDFISKSGGGGGPVSDGSITEDKLHEDLKNKLSKIDELDENARRKYDPITESDLDEDLRTKLTGPKTWADLMGR